MQNPYGHSKSYSTGNSILAMQEPRGLEVYLTSSPWYLNGQQKIFPRKPATSSSSQEGPFQARPLPCKTPTANESLLQMNPW